MPFYYTLDYLTGNYALVFINTNHKPPVHSFFVVNWFTIIPQ